MAAIEGCKHKDKRKKLREVNIHRMYQEHYWKKRSKITLEKR